MEVIIGKICQKKEGSQRCQRADRKEERKKSKCITRFGDFSAPTPSSSLA